MTEYTQQALPSVVLLGNDHSQYSVLRQFLGEAYQKEYREQSRIVCVRHGAFCRAEGPDENGIVWASSILPRVCLIDNSHSEAMLTQQSFSDSAFSAPADSCRTS